MSMNKGLWYSRKTRTVETTEEVWMSWEVHAYDRITSQRDESKITDGVATSKPFEVTNSVIQGCVLAPTLFSIFLSAMLEDDFRGIDDGVFIQSRQYADLFNVTHFKARAKCILILVRELFADDSALLAY